ncbi:hypothetical protein [Xanthocytophaga flava]|uniref:hypothetical protein n=1 Tax=Xanthocytophaga flava TaxID=3048013 RepID=UPI0028D055B9|nr:hypothetical protein [Xanthocytophaga flavus]MDJ1468502.1 hypothetical protein [Xanthocytophaga flavus]
MKTLHIFRSILACLMIGLALFSSCKKHDPDPEVDREKFLGTYDLTETCSGSPDTYEITVSAGADENEIEIKNFYSPGIDVKATISGNKVTIPSQNFTGQFEGEPITVTFTGSGTLSGDKLTIEYSVAIPDLGSDECTAVAIKQ